MTQPPDFERRCPECGASCAADLTRCWLCHAKLAANAAGTRSVPATSQQFSIATILLVTTLVAVCLGVFRLSPGFGVALVCFAVPALIRTVVVGVQNKRMGQRLTIGDKVTAFAASLGLMVLASIAAVIAFQIACWGTCGLIQATAPQAGYGQAGEIMLWVCLAIGTLAALIVGIWILWATRPRRR